LGIQGVSGGIVTTLAWAKIGELQKLDS